MTDILKISSGKAHVFFNVFGPGFIAPSPARRRMIDRLNDGLQPDVVYNFLCVHRPRQETCKGGVFEKLIRLLLLINISECLYVL